MISKLNIHAAWGGNLAGILLKNSSVTKPTRKIIGIHGWLDNLNSMLPLAEKLVDQNPSELNWKELENSKKEKWIIHVLIDYEIYLYDRVGHGFSSHLPKGSDYSMAYNLRDLRTVAQS